MIRSAHKKITISLTEPDAKLIDEIMDLTGAYTVSEVIRDALRLARRALEKKP